MRRTAEERIKAGADWIKVYASRGSFDEAGMTPQQALATVTVVGAELLGVQDRLGRVAPGLVADLVAVEGDPLQNIDAVVTGVRWVMKDGTVVVDKRGR